MFSTETDLDVVECPYNSAHRMVRKRLQSHLIKCRRNYTEIELQKCPFNSTHLIPEPEFALHVTSCSDRKLITQYKFEEPVVKKEEEEGVKHAPVECEENWDDTDVEDYNPLRYLERSKVLVRPYCTFLLQTPQKEIKREEDKESDAVDTKPKKKVKQERPASDDEQDGVSGRPMTPPPPVIHDNHKRSRGRSRQQPSSRSRSRSGERMRRSPSPYRRNYSRDCSPPPPKSRRYTRAMSPPLRASTGYELDDDPYYNGGRGASLDQEDDYDIDAMRRRESYLDQRRYYDRYAPPAPYHYPLPMYGPLPVGRGAYRGYPYDRRYRGQTRDRYDAGY